MPTDLTIFAGQYLVYLDAVLAAVLLVPYLYRRQAPTVIWWGVAAVLLLVLGYAFAQIGAAMYNDPRPFAIDHIKPLIPHAADNGFPSDHALMAAAIVAALLLVEPLYALPFVVVGFLVDWARVGAGIHHVIDVLGSSVIVAIGLGVALFVAPP